MNFVILPLTRRCCDVGPRAALSLRHDRSATVNRHRVEHPGRQFVVESRCGAVAVGRTYLLPPLSSGGASLVRPWPRLHTSLIEPDMQISRIRLSDKTSRLHPRHVVPKPTKAYEPEVPVKVGEWIGPALATPDLVLDAQPPAQPHSCVGVERPVRFGDGAYFEVVRHQLCGVLPCPRWDPTT